MRLARVVVVFALSGWVTGALILGTNQDATFLGSLWTAPPLRSAIAAATGALVWGPVFSRTRPRWYLGTIIGVVAGLTALCLFFFIWPPDTQDGRWMAWKTAALFLTVYWRFLIPSSVLAGAAAAAWTRRPVPLPRWQQLANGDDLPERPIPAPPRPPHPPPEEPP